MPLPFQKPDQARLQAAIIRARQLRLPEEAITPAELKLREGRGKALDATADPYHKAAKKQLWTAMESQNAAKLAAAIQEARAEGVSDDEIEPAESKLTELRASHQSTHPPDSARTENGTVQTAERLSAANATAAANRPMISRLLSDSVDVKQTVSTGSAKAPVPAPSKAKEAGDAYDYYEDDVPSQAVVKPAKAASTTAAKPAAPAAAKSATTTTTTAAKPVPAAAAPAAVEYKYYEDAPAPAAPAAPAAKPAAAAAKPATATATATAPAATTATTVAAPAADDESEDEYEYYENEDGKAPTSAAPAVAANAPAPSAAAAAQPGVLASVTSSVTSGFGQFAAGVQGLFTPRQESADAQVLEPSKPVLTSQGSTSKPPPGLPPTSKSASAPAADEYDYYDDDKAPAAAPARGKAEGEDEYEYYED